jgi:3-oxoacyl-[acyl-carrier protein] reductase
MLLNGKIAIVTGSSRGIGEAIARRFAAEGAKVVLVARGEEVNTLAGQLTGEGRAVAALQADLLNETAAKDIVLFAKRTFGGLDILVNNAGHLIAQPVGMITLPETRRLLDLHVLAALNLTQICTRTMAGRPGAAILNISSIAGRRGIKGMTAYSAAKAAIIGMTYALAKELAGRGIRVNAIAPGMIQTSMTSAMDPAEVEGGIQKIGFRCMGMPEEVAQCALFLVSEMASYVTGQVLAVDGGMEA